MAANPRQTAENQEHGVVTRMCSIRSTGIVFESCERLEILSEIGLIIETNVLGLVQEWTVLGWVVDCKPGIAEDAPFKITLLFSEMPKGMRQMLSLSPQAVEVLMPRVDAAPLFGQN